MSDVMTVPAEPVTPETVVTEPNPVSTDNVDHEAAVKAEAAKLEPKPEAEPAKKLTAREAIEKAAQTVDKKEQAGDTPRDEKGKFQTTKPVDDKVAPTVEAKPGEPGKDATATPAAETPKVKQPHDDPPSRFSPEAKAAWQTVPEHARAETHRAIRELETGIEEHRKRWEPMKRFDDLARQHKTDLASAMDRYVSMDIDLNKSLPGGLDRIIRDKMGDNYGLREFIAEFSGQQPDQASSQQDRVMHELRQQVSELERQLQGVTGTIQKQTEQTVDQQIAAFSADKPNFEALSDKIAEHIRAGKTLEQAYIQAEQDAQELAKRLGFIPAANAPTPADVDLIAQTDRGTKSIAGAPGAGSSPATRKGSSSVAESVKRAFQAAG